MDIDLLSKIVKELILDNDEVTLPGVGSFVAELVPSVFSDKGYTINPPYKRLSFRQKESNNGSLLVSFYAKCNNLDMETASKIMHEFLKEMRHILEVKKTILFPGLGKLRATRENCFFFVADEDLDIYPEGFGLEPISLKTHEETPAEVSVTMAALRSILGDEDDAEEKAGKVNADGTDAAADSNITETEAKPEAKEQEGTTARQTATATDIVTQETATEKVEETAADGKTAVKAEESENAEAGSEASVAATAESPAAEIADIRDESGTGVNEADISADKQVEAETELGTATDTAAASGITDEAAAHHPVEEAGDAEQADPATATETETGEKTLKETPEAGTTTDIATPPETAAEQVGEPAVKAGESGTAETGSKAFAGTAALSTAAESATEKAAGSKKAGWKILKWTIITLFILAVTALAAFMILAHTAPDFIDSILYTQEELEILNM